MTPVVATDRLLCVPPFVCTAFCVYRLACGPFKKMTPAVATDRLLCAPPCVCTTFFVYRLACGGVTDRLAESPVVPSAGRVGGRKVRPDFRPAEGPPSR